MTDALMIGHYKVLETLGAGAMGTVQVAVDTYIDRPVAIKSLRPDFVRDPEFISRFKAEAKTLALLHHQNIAALYTPVFEEGQLHLVMELVKGQSLEQILAARQKALPIRETLAITAQACDGLSYAHEMGVVHRDVKPSNLMIGNDGRVKIMDFGIARIQGSVRLTRTGTAVGTPLYMSPEQCRGGEGDERSDIYSLAAVVYEMLSGRPPFNADTEYDLIQSQIKDPPPPLVPRVPGVTPALESAIMIALAKRPEQRFPTMKAFSDALGAAALRQNAIEIVGSATRLIEADLAGDAQPPKPARALDVALSRTNSFVRSVKSRGYALPVGLGIAVVVAAVALFAFLRSPSQPVAATPGATQSASRGLSLALAPSSSPSTAVDSAVLSQLRATVHTSRDTRIKAADFEFLKTAAKLDALPLARALADSGLAEAQFAVGMLLLTTPDHIDIDGAFTALSKSAEQGYPDAETNLAILYQRKGLLTTGQDLNAARQWFAKAADQGDAKARFWLGCYVEFGWAGLAADPAKASEYFRAAAADGFAPAHNALQAISGATSGTPCAQ